VPETGGCDGSHLVGGHRLLVCRRTQVPLVHQRPDQRAAGRLHLHRGGLPAAGVGSRQAPLVVRPRPEPAAGGRQPNVADFARAALDHGRRHHQQPRLQGQRRSAPRDNLLAAGPLKSSAKF